VKCQEDEILDLKTRSMRDNVVFSGVPESENESWEQTKYKLKGLLKDHLKIRNVDSVCIDRAHRMGNKQQKGPRPIAAKLMNQESRDIVFSHLKNLNKDSKIKVHDQLPPEILERRKRLWPKFAEAKQNKVNNVKWSLDKLFINGQCFTAQDHQVEVSPTDLETEIDINHTQHTVVDGSTFMGHSAKISSKADVAAMMANLLRDRTIAGATHNIYAYRLSNGNNVTEGQRDDGEHGAGFQLLKLLRDEKATNCMIVVTRWYGGHHIGPKRFTCIKECGVQALEMLNSEDI
jgi:hypothetical protein